MCTYEKSYPRPSIWHSTYDVMIHRWALERIEDRRENCDGADAANAMGLDCTSPKGTWFLGPWYASSSPPPLYCSMVEYQAPPEIMYRSNCPSETSASRKECLDRGEKLEGSVVLTNFTETPTWKVGPYDPADKIVFLNPVPVPWLNDFERVRCMGAVFFLLSFRYCFREALHRATDCDSVSTAETEHYHSSVEVYAC